MQRRTILGAVSVGLTAGLAGCSSGSSDQNTADGDPSGTETSSAGSDKPFQELFLRKSDIPKEGWNDPSFQISDESTKATWQIQRRVEGGFEQVNQYIFKQENTAEAKSKFDEITLVGIGGVETNESQPLDLGDESQWQAGTGDSPNVSGRLTAELIKIRNKNIIIVVSWATTPPERHDIEVSDLEKVARTVQNKL